MLCVNAATERILAVAQKLLNWVPRHKRQILSFFSYGVLKIDTSITSENRLDTVKTGGKQTFIWGI